MPDLVYMDQIDEFVRLLESALVDNSAQRIVNAAFAPPGLIQRTSELNEAIRKLQEEMAPE